MTARDAAEAALDAIQRLDGRLNAFIATTPDEARAAADAADAATADGRWLGLLHGVTVAVKDNIDMAGTPTTAGASFLGGAAANADAPVVRRLRAAGAAIVGKANMAELAFGIRSFSPAGGQCRNPWNTDHIPGGSSGGSGAAVAAGMAHMALGSDTGGSVRLPAAYCGISGLRPTLGMVPNTGSVPVSGQHDTIGPMARSVSDVARLYAVIAGGDADDPWSDTTPVPNFLPTLGDGVAGLRIGIPRNWYFDVCMPGVAEAVMDGARALERLGARLVDVTVPDAEHAQAQATVLIFSDAAARYEEQLRASPSPITPDVVTRMSMGLGFSGLDCARAHVFRMRWRQGLARLFAGEIDILLSPTSPTTAAPVEDGKSLYNATADAARNTYVGALASIPGLSVPCGFDAQGLPVGMQLEGAWRSEPVLFRAGVAFQSVTDFHRAAPPLSG